MSHAFLPLTLVALASVVQGNKSLTPDERTPVPSRPMFHFFESVYMLAKLLSRRRLQGVRNAPGLRGSKKAPRLQGATKCRVTRQGSTVCTGGRTRPSLHRRKFHPWAGK